MKESFETLIRDGAQNYKAGGKNKLIYLPKYLGIKLKKDTKAKITIEVDDNAL